jgi:hypothetical protein
LSHRTWIAPYYFLGQIINGEVEFSSPHSSLPSPLQSNYHIACLLACFYVLVGFYNLI